MTNQMKSIALVYVIMFTLIITSCNQISVNNLNSASREKFEPEDGKCILFIGQDMGAIGGLDDYNDGYFDHFDIPGGFTMYTNFRPGDESFGHTHKGLDGVRTTDNWGSGDCNMQMQLDDPDFKNCVLAIGLELVNHDSLTAVGEHDSLIIELGKWIQGLGERPVFLRIGYEFDAPDWNNYNPTHYKNAFRRIRTMYDSIGIENIAYVWQSKGWGTTEEEFEGWYPGDEYVDWCGYTHFVWGVEGGKPMIDFARKRGKPVFIAEATPMIFIENTDPTDCFLDNPEQATHAWNSWFEPFFKVIHENPDVVKAISYISVDWPSQTMWENNSPFKFIDSRLHINDSIKQAWIEEMNKETYVKASDDLFDKLWGN